MQSTEWVEASCSMKLSPFQSRVCEILGMVSGGIHNAPVNWSDGVVWCYGRRGMSVVWEHDHLATYDTCKLTYLVLLCCEARIRLEISHPFEPHTGRWANARALRLSFWQRKEQGRLWERHPSLDEFFAELREMIPADSPLLYRNHPENKDGSGREDGATDLLATDVAGAGVRDRIGADRDVSTAGQTREGR